MEMVGPKDKRKNDAFGSELSGSSKKANGASKRTVATSNRQSTVLELQQAAENLVSSANEREEPSAGLLELRQENVEELQVGDQVQIESEQGQAKELEVEQSGREAPLRTSMESDKDLERTASDQGFKGYIPRITNQVHELGASLPTILDNISMEKQQDALEEVRRTRNILHDLSEDTNSNLILLGRVFELQEKLILAKESMKKQVAGFCQEYENLQCKLESLKERIDQRAQQIEVQEAQHELEQRNLLLQIEENAIGNSAMKLAALKPKSDEENVMKLAEDQRRQKEELHDRITQLEKQLDHKQALGVEIEQLRGSFKEFKYMGEEGDALRKLEETLQELKAKEKELENLAASNQTLIVKERESSNELQARNALLIKLEAANKALTDENKEMREKYAQKEDQCKSLEISLNSLVDKEKMSTLELQNARKKLIRCIKKHFPNGTNVGTIGLKQLGEIDPQPFKDVCRNQKRSDVDPIQLCSYWQLQISNPQWHPFKIDDQTSKEIVDEDDEKLKELKNEWGDGVVKAVANALLELNEYSSSRSVISELWNFGQGRKAHIDEVIKQVTRVQKTQNNGVQERQSKKRNNQDRGTQNNEMQERQSKKAQNKRVQETQNDGVKETKSKAHNDQAQKTHSKKKKYQVRGTQNNQVQETQNNQVGETQNSGVQKTKKGADVDLHVYDSDGDGDDDVKKDVLVLEQ